MDVVDIVRMVHNVDIMISILFTDFQQLLLKFQRRLVIDSDSNSSHNDKKLTTQKQQDIVSNLDGQERERFKKRLNKHIAKWLKKDLPSTDQRILTGVLTGNVSRVDKVREEDKIKQSILNIFSNGSLRGASSDTNTRSDIQLERQDKDEDDSPVHQ